MVLRRAFHPVGLAVALFFFAQSMTPSLLPRVWYLQGVATGISVATGYGLGCLVAWILRRCGVQPRWSATTRRYGWWVLAAVAVVVIPTFLVLGSWWQQIVRELVGLERLERLLYLPVLPVAVVVALVLIALARVLRFGVVWLSAFSARFMPDGVAKVAAIVVVVVLLVVVFDHGLYRGILSVAESSAAASDHGTADGVNRPDAPERSGSPDSFEDWDTLGREGRTFVAGGPTADEIADATGEPALTPIRAYVGKESADTVAEGAEKVVAELDRTGAFDRSVVAVVTTTGRGWVNENVAGALEFVSGGDSAIAAMQYSFLPSPLAFLADRETPEDAGRALFDAVYERWDDLPEDTRPKLVVFGESLGSYGGQAAFASGDAIVELTDGALLVGTRTSRSRGGGSPRGAMKVPSSVFLSSTAAGTSGSRPFRTTQIFPPSGSFRVWCSGSMRVTRSRGGRST